MALNFTKEMYEKAPYLSQEEGKHSRWKAYLKGTDKYLIKEFVRTDDGVEAKAQVSRLLANPAVTGAGYPLDWVSVDGEMIGYLCSWFQNAYSFAYAGTTNLPAFTLAEKQQAVLDTTAQLKAFHQNGFIVGDVRGSNHLIDKTGGHLIDFEDSFAVGNEKICNAPFYFYHEENKTLAINLATQEEDCRKQNLIHIGFLLGVELEYPMYALRENALLLSDAFGVDKTLQAIAQEIFFGEHPPYFDAYLPFFQDEEKNQYEGKKIHKKIQKELIKWYQ